MLALLQSWMLREVKEAIILRSDDAMMLALGFFFCVQLLPAIIVVVVGWSSCFFVLVVWVTHIIYSK